MNSINLDYTSSLLLLLPSLLLLLLESSLGTLLTRLELVIVSAVPYYFLLLCTRIVKCSNSYGMNDDFMRVHDAFVHGRTANHGDDDDDDAHIPLLFNKYYYILLKR